MRTCCSGVIWCTCVGVYIWTIQYMLWGGLVGRGSEQLLDVMANRVYVSTRDGGNIFILFPTWILWLQVEDGGSHFFSDVRSRAHTVYIGGNTCLILMLKKWRNVCILTRFFSKIELMGLSCDLVLHIPKVGGFARHRLEKEYKHRRSRGQYIPTLSPSNFKNTEPCTSYNVAR